MALRPLPHFPTWCCLPYSAQFGATFPTPQACQGRIRDSGPARRSQVSYAMNTRNKHCFIATFPLFQT